MKPVPDEVRFVCESVKIPPVNLRNASQRALNPPKDEPAVGWPRIHQDIKKFRRE